MNLDKDLVGRNSNPLIERWISNLPQLLKIQLKTIEWIWKSIFKYLHPNKWNGFCYDGFENSSNKNPWTQMHLN